MGTIETAIRGSGEVFPLLAGVGVFAATFYLLRPRMTIYPTGASLTTIDGRTAVLGLQDPNPTKQQFLQGVQWDFPDEGTMESFGVIPILMIGGAGGWTSALTGVGGAVAWHALMSTQLFTTKLWLPQAIYDDMVAWNRMFRLPAPSGTVNASITLSAGITDPNAVVINAESWVARQRLIYGLKALGVGSFMYFMLNRLVATKPPST